MNPSLLPTDTYIKSTLERTVISIIEDSPLINTGILSLHCSDFSYFKATMQEKNSVRTLTPNFRKHLELPIIVSFQLHRLNYFWHILIIGLAIFKDTHNIHVLVKDICQLSPVLIHQHMYVYVTLVIRHTDRSVITSSKRPYKSGTVWIGRRRVPNNTQPHKDHHTYTHTHVYICIRKVTRKW